MGLWCGTALFLVNADVLASTILYVVWNVDIVSLFVFGSITRHRIYLVLFSSSIKFAIICVKTSDFKITHSDNWSEPKIKFTEYSLSIIRDLSISALLRLKNLQFMFAFILSAICVIFD